MSNIIKIEKNYEYYEKLDNRQKNGGDLLSRIKLWQSAEKDLCDIRVYKNLAELYRLADLNDYSAQYWYKFLNRITEKQDKKEAFNGLGNAYFLLGNVKVSNYYLNNAFLVGGAIDPDDLDEEVVEYFANDFEKGDAYKIVYPPEKADYTSLIEDAKEAFVSGETEKAKSIYNKIPKGSRFYSEARTELSVIEFVVGNTDKAIEYSFEAVKANENNLFALCNLSSMYFVKGDKDNSRRYFDRAIKLTPNGYGENLKLAMACCEQKEHSLALKYLQSIEEEKKYDISVKFLIATANYNLGYLQTARDKFFEALSLKGRDYVLEYYIKLTDLAIDRGLDGKKNDLKYFMNVPELKAKENKKEIERLSSLTPDAISKALKKEETFSLLTWAINYADSETGKTAIYILASSSLKRAKDYMLSLLLEVSISDYLKRVILTVLTIDGYNKNVGMVVGNVYGKSKLYALSDSVPDRILYSYAGCVSVLAPVGVENFSKLKETAESIAKADENILEKLDGPYLSAVITVLSKTKVVSEIKNAVKLFKVDENKLLSALDTIRKNLNN